LERSGFRVRDLQERDSSVGHAHLITVGADGEMDVGTDPRADGAALAT
jgi:gamma-glutamyltranspeptidase